MARPQKSSSKKNSQKSLQNDSSNGLSTLPAFDVAEEVPVELRPIFYDIVRLTDAFCHERLNQEYLVVCWEMAIYLCQPGSPAVRGKRESWASGIVYTVGWINFLQDPSFEPYVRSEEIADWFGVSVGTMQSKSKTLREGLDIGPLEPEFTVISRLEQNPLVWMIELDGLVIDLRTAPREVQEAAYAEGIIPYVPADGPPLSVDYQVVHQRVSQLQEMPEEFQEEGDLGFKLTVTLKDVQPRVWRTLRVPDCTLDELHEFLQEALGWYDCHLHEFRVGRERFVMENELEFDDLEDDMCLETEVWLSGLVAAGHKELEYWYDFGDGWQHTIKIEQMLELDDDEMVPVCLKGGGACPPEDVGGPMGYAEFLEAIADPQHEMHEEYSTWVGGEFDPDDFDIVEVNALLREHWADLF